MKCIGRKLRAYTLYDERNIYYHDYHILAPHTDTQKLEVVSDKPKNRNVIFLLCKPSTAFTATAYSMAKSNAASISCGKAHGALRRIANFKFSS